MAEPTTASDDPLLARALALGEQAWRRGEHARAGLLLGQALARAEARRDVGGALSARQLLGHLAFEAGELEGAAAHHRAVLEGSAHLGLALGVASATHNLGLVAAARGDEAAARQLIAEAAARYEALGHAAGAEAARANLARLEAQWGDG
jgi:hypothetical protein